MGKKVPPIDQWEEAYTNEQTIEMLRDYFGMSKLEEKKVECKSCGRLMDSQFNSGVRIQHFCAYCHYQQGMKIQEFF